MVMSWYEVAHKRDSFASMVDHDHLVALAVTASDLYAYAWRYFSCTVQKADLATLLQGHEIMALIRLGRTLVGVDSFFPSLSLNKISGGRESGHCLTRSV
jgi:hypothetical protein